MVMRDNEEIVWHAGNGVVRTGCRKGWGESKKGKWNVEHRRE